ncbi:hypothetical protein E2562_031866 [Oryza meyeriana var. granulata]|uniref:Uncharacterized protein n=1 Tax=Oryza meyeriana var. granulata TaxID=110450 RepID=A0A6G1CIH6_9ORYZ|nr:hypothetical protein E2562_031866 [Oryza meyeriana var. granulata]
MQKRSKVVGGRAGEENACTVSDRRSVSGHGARGFLRYSGWRGVLVTMLVARPSVRPCRHDLRQGVGRAQGIGACPQVCVRVFAGRSRGRGVGDCIVAAVWYNGATLGLMDAATSSRHSAEQVAGDAARKGGRPRLGRALLGQGEKDRRRKEKRGSA